MKGSQNRLKSGRAGSVSEVYERVPNFGRIDNAKHIKACTLNQNERCDDYKKIYDSLA